MMRHVDLFSGIGGFALAARMVGGIETVEFCEREPYAQRVLRKHWPYVPICNDIYEFKGNEYGPIDFITGGFPCQPYSVAGKRRGNEDDRAIWPQMLRVIREARPRWVLGENVPGIISLALDGVLADLEAEGYACESFVVPACAVDAKHRRDRVWIVANSNKSDSRTRGNGREYPIGERAHNELAGPDQGPKPVAHRTCNGWRQGKQDAGRCIEGTGTGPQSGSWNNGETLADCHEQRPQRHGRLQQCASELPSGPIRWPDEEEWFAESGMGRVAHGIPNRVDRLRGLGNAIVPQVAAEILRFMILVDQQFHPAGAPAPAGSSKKEAGHA